MSVEEIEESDAIKLMDSLRADVDKLRERAKAVANLLATASGALIAGLFFSAQGEALALSTKIVGYSGVAVLVSSVCLFLAASIYQSKIENATSAGPDNRSIEQMIKDVDEAARRAAGSIWKRTRIGKILGAVGIGLLGLMWFAPLAFPDERVPVLVQMLAPISGGVRACPLLGGELEGMMKRKDLDDNTVVVNITVNREECGAGAGATELYLERNRIIISTDVR